MSNLVRRIQRMPHRTSIGAKKRSIDLHIGDRLGIHREQKRAYPGADRTGRIAHAIRRSKKSQRWLDERAKDKGDSQ